MPQEIKIRNGTVSDIHVVKKIADQNSRSLGFLMRAALEESIGQNWLKVAVVQNTISGFVRYRMRRDMVLKIYEICVAQEFRGRSLGRLLIGELCQEGFKLKATRIELRCPEELPANRFYEKMGFKITKIDKGKNRRLINWALKLESYG
jgi:ribosomal protein S18 acetylase RimI-like enzyme